MPRLSCWFIKAALAYLSVGVVFGGLMLSAEGQPAALGWAWRLLPAHIQLLIGGWLIQLALGVAYWILPRLDGAGNRGREGSAWTSFVTLNLGVIGAAVLLALRPFVSAWWFDMLLAPTSALQVLALGAFARHAWPRVQPLLPATPKS